MTNTETAIEVTREALAHAERHGFTFPAQPGYRLLATDNGMATLRADDERVAALTVLASVPGLPMTEVSARLSDFTGSDPSADLLDWVEDALVTAKRRVS